MRTFLRRVRLGYVLVYNTRLTQPPPPLFRNRDAEDESNGLAVREIFQPTEEGSVSRIDIAGLRDNRNSKFLPPRTWRTVVDCGDDMSTQRFQSNEQGIIAVCQTLQPVPPTTGPVSRKPRHTATCSLLRATGRKSTALRG